MAEVGASRTGSAKTAHVFCECAPCALTPAVPCAPLPLSHNSCLPLSFCSTCAPSAEDLDEEGLDNALQCVADVFDDPPVHSTYSEIARRIRVELDKKMGVKGWSVVVGRSYGAYITQKIKAYAYVSVFPGECRQQPHWPLLPACLHPLTLPTHPSPVSCCRRECAGVEGMRSCAACCLATAVFSPLKWQARPIVGLVGWGRPPTPARWQHSALLAQSAL